jgi:hypothetical protein
MENLKITNITQGRLEIKAYKTVLEPGGFLVKPEPIADEVMWRRGEGLVRIETVQATPEVKPEAGCDFANAGSKKKNK